MRGSDLALVAAALTLAAAAPSPVIIDTDIGDDIDDAFAVALAVRDPTLEVLGVVTSFGDVSTRVLLTRRLLTAMGRSDIPVARGESTKDPVPFTQRAWAEGASDRSAAPAAVPDAAGFIRSETSKRPGEVTLLAIAPLGDVASLIAREPAAYRELRQVVMMGGSVHAGYGPGASAPGAEYNVAQAPAAAAAVLGGGVPVVMFPLDSTRVQLDADRSSALFAHRSATTAALAELTEQWRASNTWGQTQPTLFDVVPVEWVGHPALCRPEPLRIAVGADGFTRVADGPANVRACLTADVEEALDILIRTLTDGAP